MKTCATCVYAQGGVCTNKYTDACEISAAHFCSNHESLGDIILKINSQWEKGIISREERYNKIVDVISRTQPESKMLELSLRWYNSQLDMLSQFLTEQHR
jgi:hypothetical protein